MYRYFISYAVPNGFGRVEIHRDAPITGIDDITALEQTLRAGKSTALVVLHFQEFDQTGQQHRRGVSPRTTGRA